VSKIIYEVLEADTIQELEKTVQVRLAMGATLAGGVATAAVWVPDFNVGVKTHGGKLLQLFYQAVTYPEMLDESPAAAAKRLSDEIGGAVDQEVSRRIAEYKKYWNPKTGKYEIDKGDELKEWICTEDELYNDVRRSVIEEME